MRPVLFLTCLICSCASPLFSATPHSTLTPPSAPAVSLEEATLRRIYTEALARGQAFDHLRTLVTANPGRLAGSPALERAIVWAEQTLQTLALDRVYKQDVMVPHWKRGAAETFVMTSAAGAEPLTGLALGGSEPTPGTGIVAEVVELKSLDELVTLGRAKLEGKIIFFNRQTDPY